MGNDEYRIRLGKYRSKTNIEYRLFHYRPSLFTFRNLSKFPNKKKNKKKSINVYMKK